MNSSINDKTFGISPDLRFGMFNEMVKRNPRMWSHTDHFIFMFGNSLSLSVGVFYSLQLYLKHVQFPDFKAKVAKGYFHITLAVVGFASFYWLRSGEFDKMIYEKYYGKLKDEDFVDLYNYVMGNTRDFSKKNE